MRKTPHAVRHGDTWIARIRDVLEHWRRQNGWSREALVQIIVEAHERIGGDMASGIKFEPGSVDQFTRMKTNAERVYRWLDDVAKENNLLPVNFIPSILAALPLDLRVPLANELMLPSLLRVEHLPEEGEALDVAKELKDIIKTASDAQLALTSLLDGIDPGETAALHDALLALRTEVDQSLLSVGALLAKEVAA